MSALAFCGCGDATHNKAAYVPPLELARAALDAALRAWRDGPTTAPITASGRAVEVSDTERVPGRPLRAFEILGPIGADEARAFAVRLSFAPPVDSQTVRYLVVGLDPIWVFRQEDYDRISHWEHKMEEETETAEPPSPVDKTEGSPPPVPDHVNAHPVSPNH